MNAALATRGILRIPRLARGYAAPPKPHHKILVVGGGSGGLSVANQVYNRFKEEGKALGDGDVAIVDAAEWHSYQPGWTLVGAGLQSKVDLRRRLVDLIPAHIALVPQNVASFQPEFNSVTLTTGESVTYDSLIVSAGMKTNWDNIKGFSAALADYTSGVSSIYSYETCDKTWADIESFRGGKALFTQPAGVIKCAGAPQKIMWMAWDRWRRTKRLNETEIEFVTGMPSMFSVKKYSDALNALRVKRGIEASFEHNLVEIDHRAHIAKFKKPDGEIVEKEYTLLHATPPMGPLDFIKNSPLADSVGWVDVDQFTLRHKKYPNVWSLGDCSSLPTSKTAAAITVQTPVLVDNLYRVAETGEIGGAQYDGYTSCPLLIGYGELMLAEFTYGGVPKETFHSMLGIDQVTPRRFFYHLKKDIFPLTYFNYMTKGLWYGPHLVTRPKYPAKAEVAATA
ncbi:sulfide-quinone oxidoreductase [Dacryopinax primogenitus]|uniref:Sulfide:quinone oxidoreductase, mitochondrial n=1 Tax=Dacryopinax primogenitus (strain DJM 731) TaxID=1858805 RepID=M5GGM4_DACPD|nr:sulfide-quinone oxidoreductase [Dacryopinax primogenitus]EJU05743.1 sulfide-quinone oxidoreductase [Dacryopinax primogenitus]